MMRWVLECVAGAVLGFGLMAWMTPATNAAPRRAAAPPVPLSMPAATTTTAVAPPGCPQLPALKAELAVVNADIEAARVELESLHVEQVAVEGAPLSWTPETEVALGEAALNAALGAALAKVPAAEVMDLDCGEFPCIFRIQAAGEDETRPHEDALELVRQAFPGALLVQGAALMVEGDDGELTFGETMALVPNADLTESEQQRIRFRLEGLL